ncbi:MAG: MFS transporter [Spirochaetales bacterium]|nr:MFS transporter [Spirochaetales bacterium]
MKPSDSILKIFVQDEYLKLSDHERSTFFLDSFRSGVDGIIQTFTASVFLLIGIRYFGINDFWKSIISSSIHFGMIISLFSSSFLSHHKPNQVAGISTLAGGLLLVLSAFSRSTAVYALTLLLCGIFLNIRMPQFTAIYAENYHPSRMGKLFGAGILLSVITGLASNLLSGALLEANLEWFRWLYAVSGSLVIVSGLLLLKVPFDYKRVPVKSSPLKNLSLLIKYPVFGRVSLSWFILGFANLWSIPLRTVYLVESERGLGLNPLTVMIILGVIPSTVRFLCNNYWGRIFDRFSFLPIRMITSLMVGAGIFLFFLTENIILIIAGQIIMNIGFAAAPFLWNLWVTKVAPPGESRAFMSVHTFLCGLRGILGPFLGFAFIQTFPMRTVGTISLGLIVFSVTLLFPLLNRPLESRS